MDTRGIPPVYTPNELVDIAFRRASKEARNIQIKDRRLRKKRSEERRVKETSAYITYYLSGLERIGDRVSDASPFLRELFEITFGIEKLLTALDRLTWAKKEISKLADRSRRNIRTSKDDPVTLRKDFYGKTSSILRKTARELDSIGKAVKIIKGFPSLKEEYTVVIAGMPNVGKSSLLKGLTSSKPDVQPYPFTTKNILVGYMMVGHRKVQIIDTPGLLDRPLKERNPIERQAVLALKDLADLILFLFDPSETCGFTMESQMRLFKEISKSFEKVVPVMNKTDITDRKLIDSYDKEIGEKSLRCSSLKGEVEEVYSLISHASKNRDRSGSSMGE